MKPLQLIILATILSISFSNGVQAQFLKKLKAKVQQAAEDVVIDKASQKAAQEAGKALDSLLEIDPNYQAKNQEQLENMLFQSGDSIAINDVYSFSTNVDYKMEYTSDNKPTTADYSMWFSDNENYMASEIKNIDSNKSQKKQLSNGMISIIDNDNQAMIIIMEEQKMAQIISMEKIKNIDIVEENNKDQDIKTDFQEVKKTGETKKILGYLCEEYISNNTDAKMTFWITQDVKLYQKNMFLNMSKSLGGETFKNIPDSAKGFTMEMNYENKSNGDKSSIVVTHISKKSKIIKTADYQMMNLSGFMKN